MDTEFAFATDIGLKRKQNQDSGAAFPEMGLFLVADGMGGHKGGETASQMVIDVVPNVIQKALESEKFDPQQALVDAIGLANEEIYRKSQEIEELQGMGTTATVLLLRDGIATIGHVGDSRCYFVRPRAIWQLTRDHSLVQEKLRAGMITRAQMRTDRFRNVITRSVGFDPEINVEVFEMIVQAEDLFLLCTDGLSGLVDDSTTLEVIARNVFQSGDPNLEDATAQLVETAKKHGGDDNITVLLGKVLGDRGKTE